MKKTKKLPPVVDLSTLSPCINNEYHEDYYKKANGVLVGRIYPNKEQKQKIEDILHGVRVFYNCSLYDAKHGLRNVKEFHGYKVPDFSAMAKKEHLDYMRENNPCIRCVPATALSGKSGIILKNAVVSYKKSQFKSIDKWQPNYFSDKDHPIKSYVCAIRGTGIKETNNSNVLKININKIGWMSLRGINKDILFEDAEHPDNKINFLEYCKQNPKKSIYYEITKDVDSYTVSIRISDFFQKQKKLYLQCEKVGIDVGTKTHAVTSENMEYPNNKYKARRQKEIEYLQNKLLTQWGYNNPKFRHARSRTKKDGQYTIIIHSASMAQKGGFINERI